MAGNHLLKSIVSSKWATEDRVCYLDSEEALNLIEKIKVGIKGDHVLIDCGLRELIIKLNFTF